MKKTRNIKIAIVYSTYRKDIADNLLRHCLTELGRQGIKKDHIDQFAVPGALEIPLTAKHLAKKKIYDAIIVLGAVFKGRTYHFEQVANECVRGCMNVSYEFEIPVIFEVLCVYDLKDAMERSTGIKDNRGIEAARSALSMIKLLKQIS